jgi:hypothetical protein
MSEFVECQNCGRRFFAENIECPYCRDEQEARARSRGPDSGDGMFRILFASFHVVLLFVALVSFLAARRVSLGPSHLILMLESTAALVTLLGLVQRRRWGRRAAIVFILANAVFGLAGLIWRGEAEALAWGPGPLALLVFLLPFLTAQARQRYCR